MPLEKTGNAKRPIGFRFPAAVILLIFFVLGSVPPAMGMAFDQTLHQAQGGDADASYYLGIMYQTGNGVRQDCSEALEWTTRAASQGHVLAQSHLGVMYRDGCGEAVGKNFIEAYVWMSLAAEKGLKVAGQNLESLKRKMHPYLIADAQRRTDMLKSSSN